VDLRDRLNVDERVDLRGRLNGNEIVDLSGLLNVDESTLELTERRLVDLSDETQF